MNKEASKSVQKRMRGESQNLKREIMKDQNEEGLMTGSKRNEMINKHQVNEGWRQ